MFSSAHRQDHDGRAPAADRPAQDRWIADALRKNLALAILFIDRENNLLPHASEAATALLRCRDLRSGNIATLLRPLVAEKTLHSILATRDRLRQPAPADAPSGAAELANVDLRLPNPDGTVTTACCRFTFSAVDAHPDRDVCMVAIADETADVQHLRELVDMRKQVQIQSEILRSLLQTGRARFAASMQRIDAAMSAINATLKKPAREQPAFRLKLEETLVEVDRIRREGAALKITSLEGAARSFEDSLHELRSRARLSGGDFLPLAVKLDELFGQYAIVRALTKRTQPPTAEASSDERVTDNGTQIIDAPRLIAKMAAAGLVADEGARAQVPPRRPARSGSLESTLASLSGHIAEECAKDVKLECVGLDLVPAVYQSAVKNVAIQLIRNAIMHGVETREARALAGKPACAALRLTFAALPDGGFEMRFQDDGCGIDPHVVRRIAVAKGLIGAQAAAALPDRQAIKLIFKSRFTTIAASAAAGHGGGLTLVRRYVDESGGKIALASLPGRDTRFKVSLPAVPPPDA